MSAPVTEAHRLAANAIFALAMKSSHHGAPFREPCAQLIADNEALACAELRAECNNLRAELADQVARFHEEIARRQEVVRDNKALDLKERDQLCAEVERLTAACDKFSNSEIEQGDWKARAERAEDELATERAKVRMLHSALQNLADEQNGAPLERRREKWEEAMNETRAALAATEDTK